jgi:hypothetical protein
MTATDRPDVVELRLQQHQHIRQRVTAAVAAAQEVQSLKVGVDQRTAVGKALGVLM